MFRVIDWFLDRIAPIGPGSMETAAWAGDDHWQQRVIEAAHRDFCLTIKPEIREVRAEVEQ
ncbi:MAG: hypothetical protein ACM31L_02425 [Actinomycetota bacterium]